MGYVTIKKETTSQLSLLREPSFLSKAVFVGFFVGVLGIFAYGSESLFFKALIGIGAACLSCLIVDNYEMCDFNKETAEVRFTRLHWFQYFLNQYNLLPAQPYVTANLNDIKDVRVEEQGEQTSGASTKAYQVVLYLDTGIQMGVTEVFTTDDISVHQEVAKQIRSFLGGLLPPLRADDEADDEQEEEEDDNNKETRKPEADQESSSGSDVEDFEQISKADLEGLEEMLPSGVSEAPGHRDGAGDTSGIRSEVEDIGENQEASSAINKPVD